MSEQEIVEHLSRWPDLMQRARDEQWGMSEILLEAVKQRRRDKQEAAMQRQREKLYPRAVTGEALYGIDKFSSTAMQIVYLLASDLGKGEIVQVEDVDKAVDFLETAIREALRNRKIAAT